MTMLDNIVAWVSPQAGLRRVRARAALSALRAYEGAGTGRRTDNWRTTSASANAEVAPSVAKLRDRSRDAVRNNPYARRAIATLTASAVGTGIQAKWPGRAVDPVWKQWVLEGGLLRRAGLLRTASTHCPRRI